MNQEFHLTHHLTCDYLSMLWKRLIHVSKMGCWSIYKRVSLNDLILHGCYIMYTLFECASISVTLVIMWINRCLLHVFVCPKPVSMTDYNLCLLSNLLFASCPYIAPLIATFMGSTWGRFGADRSRVDPILAHKLCCLGYYVCMWGFPS